MQEYIDLVNDVLQNGHEKVNRTGVKTISAFARHYTIDLAKGFPILTTKKVAIKACIDELLWFISGVPHIADFRKQSKIWNEWADEDGKLETAYGRFWRYYPYPAASSSAECFGEKWSAVGNDTFLPDFVNPKYMKYHHVFCDDVGNRFCGFDQLQFVIDTLKDLHTNPENPNGRRLIITAWHPVNAFISKLPPCHYTFAFYVDVSTNTLSCHLTQRSGDIALGIPFNISSYSLLLSLVAAITGYEIGSFSHTIIDAHIYENHIDGLKEQIKREPLPLPKLIINTEGKKRLEDFTRDDFSLENYQHHDPIKFDVAV